MSCCQCSLQTRTARKAATVGACVDREGVVSTESLESSRQQCDVHVGIDAVATLVETLKRLACRDVRVHKGSLVVVAVDTVFWVVEEHVAQSEVALCAHVQIAESRQRHIVLLVIEGRVQVVAELVVLCKVARVKTLGHHVAAYRSQCSGEYIFT